MAIIVLAAAVSNANSAAAAISTQILLAANAGSNDSASGLLIIPSIATATNKLQNALVDALLRGQPLGPPSTWYVGLTTLLGDPTAPGTEVSGGSYARVAVAASLAAWAGTQGAGTTVASNGTSGLTSNNALITFPAPTADWGTVVGYELWDAASGGSRWISGKLAAPVTILNGSGARKFAIAALTLSVG